MWSFKGPDKMGGLKKEEEKDERERERENKGGD